MKITHLISFNGNGINNTVHFDRDSEFGQPIFSHIFRKNFKCLNSVVMKNKVKVDSLEAMRMA